MTSVFDPELGAFVPPAVDPAAERPLTDAGNAEVFVAMYGDLVRYDHLRRVWRVWDTHRWRTDSDGAVHRMALEAVRERLRAAGRPGTANHEALAKHALASEARNRVDALLALARTMLPVADDGRGWDATPGLLGVPNGVVDLRTGELRPGRREDRITMQAGAEYDPAAAAPRWERFLREVFGGDDELIGYVQRLAGYGLTGEATLDKAAFLMGVGSNGKTTFLSVLRAAVGDYAREVSAVAILDENRSAHSTEVADLEGARMATCEEVGDAKLNASRFKAITGGGEVRARRMRQDTVSFPVTWALWLTTNGVPQSDDNSAAFWRRVAAVPFDRRFAGKDADPDLEKALTAELPGVLAWMAEGARQWYAEGLGEEPAAVRARTADYREEVDPLEPMFEQGALVDDPDAWTPTSKLYEAYVGWANVHLPDTLFKMGERGFGTKLAARFTRAKGYQADGRQVRGFRGVRVGP